MSTSKNRSKIKLGSLMKIKAEYHYGIPALTDSERKNLKKYDGKYVRVVEIWDHGRYAFARVKLEYARKKIQIPCISLMEVESEERRDKWQNINYGRIGTFCRSDMFLDRYGFPINTWDDIKKGRTLVKILDKCFPYEFPSTILKIIMLFAMEKQVCKECHTRVFTIADYEGTQSGVRKDELWGGFVWCTKHDPGDVIQCPSCSKKGVWRQLSILTCERCDATYCFAGEDEGGCGANEYYCSQGCFYQAHLDGWC